MMEKGELPDFLPLAGFEFHPEIQVRLGIFRHHESTCTGIITIINREDLIKIQQKDGCVYTKDFHILLEEVKISSSPTTKVQCLIVLL